MQVEPNSLGKLYDRCRTIGSFGTWSSFEDPNIELRKTRNSPGRQSKKCTHLLWMIGILFHVKIRRLEIYL